MLWKKEDFEKVKELAAQGLTAREIAKHFPHRTRNSVIGLCHRKKIKLMVDVNGKPKMPAPPPKYKFNDPMLIRRKPARKKVKFPPKTFQENSSPILEKSIFEPEPIVFAPKNKTIMELGPFDCRAIDGEIKGMDTVYCGDRAVFNKPWCSHHLAIFTVPADASRRVKRDSDRLFKFYAK